VGAPTGTVTFLFTDIEGSTRLWDRAATAMRTALARHDAIVRGAIESHGGHVFASGGDGFAAAFERAGAGLGAALAAQSQLGAEVWPDGAEVRVRMGLHTGEVEERDGDYFGPAVNRAARLMAVAHGGQVVCSEVTAGLAPEIPIADLGEHRLRDLDRPLRVFQVGGGPFPPLRTLDAFPGNLPAQVTAFVGRDDEQRAVAKALEESRVVTLTGVGGVGKTRLALQVAADAVPGYADGAWLVELGGVADADAVEEVVATTLTVQPQPGQSLRESLISYLRMKRLLVVLDNCEHLLEPVGDFVDRAVRAAPRVTVLATSREALGVAGERVLGVRSLPMPATDDDPVVIATADAVRLFVERAQSARADFALTADSAETVARLCRRLDGIPLAIELAAARVRSMAPAEIAARLDQRFRLLTGGTRRTASRHQTLRRAIDWSWDLAADDERAVLRRLSVCVGGFDLAAAESIGAGDAIDALDVDDLLGHLIDKSLVVADDLGETTRYRMLETIREYGLERLEEAGEVDQARARHARHYAAFAEEAGVGLRTAREREWLERTEQELDNLRLAVTWSADSGVPEFALRIVSSLALEGVRIETSVGAWAEVATSSPGATSDPRFPGALGALAWATMRKGENERAVAMSREALSMSSAETREGAVQRAKLLSTTVGMAGTLGMPLDAALVAEWVELARRIADPYEEARALIMLSVIRIIDAEDGAVEVGELAVDRAKSSGSATAVAYALFSLAGAIGVAHAERALRLLDEAIIAADSVRNDFAAWVAGNLRAALLTVVGDHARAMRSALDSCARAARAGDRTQQALCLWVVAAELALAGRPEAAATVAGWVRSVLGDYRGQGLLLQGIEASFNSLPGLLSEARYSELTTTGAEMDSDEVVDFARAEVESLEAEPQ
jgi:predicted ATPase/class 3 adenylate cyclase